MLMEALFVQELFDKRQEKPTGFTNAALLLLFLRLRVVESDAVMISFSFFHCDWVSVRHFREHTS